MGGLLIARFAFTLAIAVPLLAQQQQQPGQTSKEAKAEQQVQQEEKQRIAGIMPNFQTVNNGQAESLTARQKYRLAFRGAVDPFVFAEAGLDAAIGQWQHEFPEYGEGASGYGKRFGASYADSFDGMMLGGAVLPSLLHQDPRYFRSGTGTVGRRIGHALSSAFRCKDDDGHWTWNYSNILGNLSAGALSNVYYPKPDRGVGLVFSRAATVTAEGSAGAVLAEFWPDIQRKLHKHSARK